MASSSCNEELKKRTKRNSGVFETGMKMPKVGQKESLLFSALLNDKPSRPVRRKIGLDLIFEQTGQPPSADQVLKGLATPADIPGVAERVPHLG